MNKKLIVTADDFGLTGRVNQAIVLAHRNGIVTSASLMVNGPAFESAVELARKNVDLDVGLHLNLTEGRSTSDPARIPSLADSAGFLYRQPWELIRALLRGKVRTVDLQRELHAQINKALSTGLEITHIDGHKHVHAMPRVIAVICRAAPALGIMALRSTAGRTPGLGSLLLRNKASRRQILKQYFIGKMVSAAWSFSRPLNERAGMIAPGRFYGIAQTGFLDLDAFAKIVGDLGNGVNEVMCHPGYVDDALDRTPTRLRFQRERELELLTGREVRDLIERAGVKLVSYRDLVGTYGSRKSDPLLHRCSAL